MEELLQLQVLSGLNFDWLLSQTPVSTLSPLGDKAMDEGGRGSIMQFLLSGFLHGGEKGGGRVLQVNAFKQQRTSLPLKSRTVPHFSPYSIRKSPAGSAVYSGVAGKDVEPPPICLRCYQLAAGVSTLPTLPSSFSPTLHLPTIDSSVEPPAAFQHSAPLPA